MDKKFTIKTLVLVALLLLGGFSASAQLSHSVYLMGTMPTGDFRNSIYLDEYTHVMYREDIGKGANVGLGLSYRASYHFDIGYGEVMPFGEISFFWNRLKPSYREEYDRVRFTDPHYFNIPVNIGIQYSYDLTTMLKPFAELGIGYDFFLATAEGKKSDPSERYNVYSVRGAMSWQLGIGTYIGPNVSASLVYYGLGKHSIDYNTNRSHFADDCRLVNEQSTEFRRVGVFALKVGFHF